MIAPDDLRGIARWVLSGVLVLGAHGAAAALLVGWSDPIVPSEPPPAVLIDLTPPAAPAAEVNDQSPGPKAEYADEVPEKQVDTPDPEDTAPEPVKEVKEPVDEPDPEPTANVEKPDPVTEPVPEPVEKSETETAPTPPAQVAVAVPLPPPAPERPKTRPTEVERAPKKDERVQRRKPRPPSPVTSAPQAVQAPPAPVATAAMAGASAAPSMSVPNYRSMIVALIQRNKRYPAEAQSRGIEGTSRVRFTIGRGGRVTDVRLIGSSGNAALDQEAVALLHRIGQFPPPPPEMGNVVAFTLPLRFNIR